MLLEKLDWPLGYSLRDGGMVKTHCFSTEELLFLLTGWNWAP